jgi:hypothetical protein
LEKIEVASRQGVSGQRNILTTQGQWQSVMNNVHVDKKLANVDKKLAQGKCIRGVAGVVAED